VIRALGLTLRVKVEDAAGIFDHPEHGPIIFALWHNRLLLMPLFYERHCGTRPVWALISRSRDGQFISDVALRFGIKSIRGSSSRHGTSAALAAVHAARDQGVDLVITPDGPRGPRYQIQPGVLRLAQSTGRPIIPVVTEFQWKKELKSWDRFQVPLPFSACRLISGEPVFVPENATEAELAAISARIGKALGGD
jgi:lysophospholipid acyltransferase (LPLAT)-like uncharacterized protein